jgi:hypothetical protein
VINRTARITAVFGLASFAGIAVAAVVAPPLWEAPDTSASAVEIAKYVQEDRGRTIASLLIYSVAMGLFLCFAAGLASWLRRFEPEPRPLSTAFAFGAVVLVALILAAFVTASVGAYRPQEPPVAQALYDVTFGLLALSGIPTAVCLGAYAGLVFQGGRLPRWTAWLAVLGALAHLLIAASFVSRTGFLSLEGEVIIVVPATFFAWIAATSAALLRAGGKPDRPAVSEEPSGQTPLR